VPTFAGKMTKHFSDGTRLISAQHGEVTLRNRRTANGRRNGVVELVKGGQVVAVFDLYRENDPLSCMECIRG